MIIFAKTVGVRFIVITVHTEVVFIKEVIIIVILQLLDFNL
jgi:hypothetical protein